ncbi:MAG: ATP-binding cassette protein [Frondihabitans sp.]|nr:ATP-binding cassette protein [Frondihabitans sp.]
MSAIDSTTDITLSDKAPSRTSRQTFFTRARRSPTLVIGIVLLVLLVLASAFAPLLTPFSPTAQHLGSGLLAPSWTHPFGTDELGRDIMSRMLYAGRTDLRIAFLAAAAPFVVGIVVGLLSGYFGGPLDFVIGRVVDTVIAFPFYVIVVALVFVIGVGEFGIYVAFALVGWVGYARVVRASTRSMRSAGWVDAARGGGLSHFRVILRHLLPNVLPLAVVLLATEIILIMVAVVTLGYLGLGVQSPTPDWGTMIQDGQNFVTTKWWLSAIPGVAVIYTGISLSLIGDGLGDAWRIR